MSEAAMSHEDALTAIATLALDSKRALSSVDCRVAETGTRAGAPCVADELSRLNARVWRGTDQGLQSLEHAVRRDAWGAHGGRRLGRFYQGRTRRRRDGGAFRR